MTEWSPSILAVVGDGDDDVHTDGSPDSKGTPGKWVSLEVREVIALLLDGGLVLVVEEEKAAMVSVNSSAIAAVAFEAVSASVWILQIFVRRMSLSFPSHLRDDDDRVVDVAAEGRS